MSQKPMPPHAAEQALMSDQPNSPNAAKPATGAIETTGSSGGAESRRGNSRTSKPTPIRARGDGTVAGKDGDARAIETSMGQETESVGKIRDILFGEQMHVYESRFVELEEHIQRESRRSQEELEKRFSRLDSFMRDEFEKIADRLQQESNDRVEAAQSTLNQLTEAEDRVGSLVNNLGAELRREHEKIKADVADRTKEQMAQLDRSRDELMKALNDYESRLRHEKLDRESLAEMLVGVADRLRAQEG